MPRPPLPPDLLELLRRPNPCVIATLRTDGQPVTVATWYLLDDDGRILVNMDAGRRRLQRGRGNRLVDPDRGLGAHGFLPIWET